MASLWPEEKALKRWSAALLSAIAFVSSSAIAAEAFPTKPIRWIVPSPPGGGTDAVARIVSGTLSEMWPQQVVIDNRGGAEGALGTALGAKAAGDGYTLIYTWSSTLSINPHVYASVGYDALRDFKPVSRLVEQPIVLTVNAAVPATTPAELVAYAKQNPGKVSWASGGSGERLAGELFKMIAGIDIVNVPYKGGGPALTDLLGGRVEMMVSAPAAVLPYIKSGKLRAIGVFGPKRLDALPDTPTLAETGFPELVDVVQWHGVHVPASTPQPVIDALNVGFRRALSSPDVVARLQASGLTASPSSPDEFNRQVIKDFDRWGVVVKRAGLKVE